MITRKTYPIDLQLPSGCPALRVEAPEQVGGRRALGRGFLLRLPQHTDERGTLGFAQYPEHLPFVPRRSFWIEGVPDGQVRGQHAHRHCHQALLAVQGEFEVLLDDGRQAWCVRLDTPWLLLYLPPLTWGVLQSFSRGAVLMAFASDPYDPADYIYDPREFIRLVAVS